MESQTHDSVPFTGPFIGLVLTSVLFGFTLLQALQYYTRFPKDSLPNKIKVAFICILDLLQFVFSIIFVHTFILDFQTQGSIQNLWSFKAVVIVQVILTVSVHFIYLQRIHTLSNIPALNKAIFLRIINAVILLIALFSIGSATVFIYAVIKIEGFRSSQITEDLGWAVFIGLSANVATDVIITALTCYVLHKNRIEIGLDYISKWSNKLLLSLFTYSLATGWLTSIIATLVIILYLAQPDTLDYMSICIIMSKLYTNSLLSLVQNVRQQFDDDVIGTKQSNLVFKGVSQRSKWTTTNVNISENVNKTSTLPVGSDLELNAERSLQDTENIKWPEIPNVFSPYWFFEAKKGPGHNLRFREPEVMDVESWISFRRIPRRAWLNWPFDRRSSL